MKLTKHALAAVAAAVVLQGAYAQNFDVVSMSVSTQDGQQVGYMCEPFDCSPHGLAIDVGSAIAVDMHGLADSPYILFAGAPSPTCYSLPWVLGAVAMDPPFLIVEVGLVQASGLPSKCGLDMTTCKLEIPADVPSGARLVLQTAAWPSGSDMPAFSRGVSLITK